MFFDGHTNMKQTYKSAEDRYDFQDKYFGRKVKTRDFPDVLASFIDNGSRILVYHIPGMLRKLYRLASIVAQLSRYRFYASSLLLIYDGDEEVQKQFEERTSLQTRGQGEDRKFPISDLPSSWQGPSQAFPAEAVPKSARSRSMDGTQKKEAAKKKRTGQITIRLIDFAHCTTGDDFKFDLDNEDDDDSFDMRPRATFPPIHPNMADTGFLLGLQSLCLALEKIWRDERQRRANDPESEEEQLDQLNVDPSVWDKLLPDGIVEEATSNGWLGRFDLGEGS